MKRETITNDKLNIGRTKMAYVALLIDLYKHEVISKEKAEEILGFKITDYYKDSPYADGGDVPPGPTSPTPTSVPVKFYAWGSSYFTIREHPLAGDKLYSGGNGALDPESFGVVVSENDGTLSFTDDDGNDDTAVRQSTYDIDYNMFTTEPITFYVWGPVSGGVFTISRHPQVGDIAIDSTYYGTTAGIPVHFDESDCETITAVEDDKIITADGEYDFSDSIVYEV